jgi:hypothetical protein
MDCVGCGTSWTGREGALTLSCSITTDAPNEAPTETLRQPERGRESFPVEDQELVDGADRKRLPSPWRGPAREELFTTKAYAARSIRVSPATDGRD